LSIDFSLNLGPYQRCQPIHKGYTAPSVPCYPLKCALPKIFENFRDARIPFLSLVHICCYCLLVPEFATIRRAPILLDNIDTLYAD